MTDRELDRAIIAALKAAGGEMDLRALWAALLEKGFGDGPGVAWRRVRVDQALDRLDAAALIGRTKDCGENYELRLSVLFHIPGLVPDAGL